MSAGECTIGAVIVAGECCRTLCRSFVLLVAAGVVTTALAEESVVLQVAPDRPSHVDYSIRIQGHIITPSADGPVRLPLTSDGEFRFRQVPAPTELGGPFTLRAFRRFEAVGVTTTVGKDLTTKVTLSPSLRTIHVFGSEVRLQQISPRYSMPRKQLDLLQMPFDVLAAGSFLPASSVRLMERWNTDAWVAPVVTGIEAVVERKVSCQLEELTDELAVVSCEGQVKGAVQGSASEVSFSGRLSLDRRIPMLTALDVVQKEKRSPGPVSPGLDVTVEIHWKQTPEEAPESAEIPSQTAPTEQQLLLSLQTPFRLQLQHSREWYLFHETPTVIMLRQLRDGHLISQCNLSAAVTVPPRQHTPDREFLEDVRQAAAERKGTVQSEQTVRDDDQWRIRQIRAIGEADSDIIIWDYYLCTATSGEQYSLVFSHARADSPLFDGEAARILSTLRVVRPGPALPFR